MAQNVSGSHTVSQGATNGFHGKPANYKRQSSTKLGRRRKRSKSVI
jgi:hypothetical protein